MHSVSSHRAEIQSGVKPPQSKGSQQRHSGPGLAKDDVHELDQDDQVAAAVTGASSPMLVLPPDRR